MVFTMGFVMRRFLLFASLLFGSLAHADILQVNISATFIGGDGCGGCTNVFDISFQYDDTLKFVEPYYYLGSVVPGTMAIHSTGFMDDSFVPANFGTDGGIVFPDSIRLFNEFGDEFDLPPMFTAGQTSTLGLILWSCASEACMTALPPVIPGQRYGVLYPPTTASISVTRVAEPSSIALIMAAILVVPVVSRRRLRVPQTR